MKKKVKFKFSWLIIILFLGLLYFSSFKTFLIYMFVVIIHEFAHYYTAKKLGYKLGNIYIMPYGVCLNYSNNIFSGNDEFLIAIAGPLTNYIMCVLCVAIWWLFPETYYVLDYFCFCNLILATFNILPCFPLDGGRMAVCVLTKYIDRSKAIKITLFLNYIFSFVLVSLFIISLFKNINFSYIFIAIFLFSGTLNPKKYSNYEHMFVNSNKQKLYKKGCPVKILAISSSIKLYKIMAKFSPFKYNIIYVILPNGAVKVLSENNINNLALRYSPTLSIDEIVLKSHN